MHLNLSKTILPMATLLVIGCAGPSTPFGSVDSLTPVAQVIIPSKKREEIQLKLVPDQNYQELKTVRLSLSPDRQVLHDHMDLTVAINDIHGVSEQSKLVVNFNGQNVKTVTNIFIPPEDRRKGYFTFRNVQLRDDRENQILTSYIRTRKDKPISAELLPPDCSLDQRQNVSQIGDFEAPKTTLRAIENMAIRSHLNPSLITGVIAQESAFDPKAISWAKAIGLTQVTPIGDRQIQDQFPNWPRSDKVNRLPASVLKTMIVTGQLTAQDDWRLDSNKSIAGGLALMNYMKAYWQREETLQVLQRNMPHHQPNLTALTLASYHSGPIRVRRAIVEKGADYLASSDLSEANRYVRRVKSYCYHFAKGTVQ